MIYRYSYNLLTLLLLAALSASAQVLEVDERSIHLRLIGEDTAPIEYKSGRVTPVEPSTPHTWQEWRTNGDRFVQRELILPDQSLFFDAFPLRLRATDGEKEMRLQLNASVGSIPFREGIYHVPLPFEPLFTLWGLDGVEIPEKNIACFEVYQEGADPEWGDLLRFTPHPLTLDGKPLALAPQVWGTSVVATRDWKDKTLFLALRHWSSDLRTRVGYRFYHENGSSTDFVSHDFPSLDSGAYSATTSLFFATKKIGWRFYTFMDRDRRARAEVRKSIDRGRTWSVDERMTELGICHAIPRDAERAWFLGMRLPVRDSELPRLTLYSGTRKGEELQRVDWPSSLETRVAVRGTLPRLIPAGPSGLIISSPSWPRLRHISFDGTFDRVIDIPGTLESYHRGPDGTGWLVVEERSDLELLGSLLPKGLSSYGSFYRLLRISSDGLSIRPILISGYPLRAASFANASLGAVIGDHFLLLTNDGGKRWQFIPARSSAEVDTEGGILALEGTLLTLYWPDPSTLRIVKTDGYIDIPIDELPPTKYCAPPERKEIEAVDID